MLGLLAKSGWGRTSHGHLFSIGFLVSLGVRPLPKGSLQLPVQLLSCSTLICQLGCQLLSLLLGLLSCLELLLLLLCCRLGVLQLASQFGCCPLSLLSTCCG